MRRSLKPEEFKRILIVRTDRFGEFLLNIPAIESVRKVCDKAKVTLAVASPVKELAESFACADEVVAWDKGFLKGMRKRRFDACLVLNPAKEAHWAAFWAGIPVRAGYDRKWGFLLTHKIKDEKHLGLKHEVEYNLELAGLLLPERAKIGSSACGSIATVEANGFAMAKGAIAIHPFTSDPVKQWPLERFMELAGRISRELGVKVVFVGKTQDGRGIERNNDNLEALDLVNKTSLVELACVLKQCRLLVTGDSGPMHLAAAAGVPVVALFRNDLPGKTARRWGPVGSGHMVIEKPRLEDISIEEVLAYCRQFM